MNPAASVILLTTLIGAGQGLLLALFTVQSYALVGLIAPADRAVFLAGGCAIVLALLAAGLVASFFHLGHPRRAWRTAARWRSSWLSREVIVLPAFMGLVAAYGLAHLLGWAPPLVTLAGGLVLDARFVLGALASVGAFALFVCTAMIYACLRFLAEWHTPLTLVNYVLLGSASGFTLASAWATLVAPDLVGFLAGWAIVLTLAAAVGRVASLRRNARLTPRSTLQTAIGVKHPRVVQTAQGFIGTSFNTREFFHRQSPRRLRWVQWLFLLAAFALPLWLLALGRDGVSGTAPAWLGAAFVVQYLGLLAERWFFFAQARHPQNLYYQAVS